MAQATAPILDSTSDDVHEADVEFRYGVDTGTAQKTRPGPLMTPGCSLIPGLGSSSRL
jgi:hypothetical protein